MQTTNNLKFTAEEGIKIINKWGQNIDIFSATSHPDRTVAVAEFIAKHYLEHAVILPTVSPITRVGFTDIHDYFCQFLSRNPKLIFTIDNADSVQVTLSSDAGGVMCGYYGFLINDKVLDARYCMQFQYLSQEKTSVIAVSGREIKVQQHPGWYIVMKHSSWCPIVTNT